MATCQSSARCGVAWSERHRPFGIHHCGKDPHRFAASYAKVPHVDFLDVGWGGDVKVLRATLPNTFLNLRLDPVQLVTWTPAQIRETITRLVADSGNLELTGICCINLDQRATDADQRDLCDRGGTAPASGRSR